MLRLMVEFEDDSTHYNFHQNEVAQIYVPRDHLVYRIVAMDQESYCETHMSDYNSFDPPME
jgi:hypothetical protein